MEMPLHSEKWRNPLLITYLIKDILGEIDPCGSRELRHLSEL